MFESLIKIAEKSLNAIVGSAGLNDDELQTAFKEVEVLMNFRPLVYEGADPLNEPVLTPSHFMIGQLGGQLAPQVTDEIAFNPKRRWRLVQNLNATLNTRKKWREAKDTLRVGDVVLVVDQNAPRGQRHLGRKDERSISWTGRTRAGCPS